MRDKLVSCYSGRPLFNDSVIARALAVAVASSGNGAAAGPVGSGVEVARAKRMLHVVLVSPLVIAPFATYFLGRLAVTYFTDEGVACQLL